MTDEHCVTITLEEFPDPVIAYAVEDDEPLIITANEAFETVFKSFSSEMPVTTLFDHFGVVTATATGDPVTHLIRGNSVGICLEGLDETGPYFARIFPSDDNTGYIVFTDLSECHDLIGTSTVDQVSSLISHDLRNPLDVAKAHLRAAQETGDPEHFDAVSNAHDRMEQIIRDVLTVTRDDIAVDPSENVSIERAANRAWESVETDHASFNVTDPLPTVTADADRVRRLFENLFRNSVEHSVGTGDRPTEHGHETSARNTVTITVGALENGFYVADDGPGIPPDERDVVFEPGYSTRDGGTGLGLAIVDRIVAAHDWTVTVTTATNGGARFEIRFDNQ